MKVTVEDGSNTHEFEINGGAVTERNELGLFGNRMLVLLVGKPLNDHQIGQLSESQKKGMK